MSTGSQLFASAASGQFPSTTSILSTLPSAASALPSARLTARTSATDLGDSTPGAAEAPVAILLAEDVRLEVPASHQAPPLPATLSAVHAAAAFPSAKPCEQLTGAAGRLASLSVAVGSNADDVCIEVDADASGVHAALSSEQVQALVCMAHMHSSKLRRRSGGPDGPPPVWAASCRLMGATAVRGVAIDSSNFDGAESDDDDDAAAAAAAPGEGMASALFSTASVACANLKQVLAP